MKFFDDPALLVPAQSLNGVFESADLHRGHESPVQWFRDRAVDLAAFHQPNGDRWKVGFPRRRTKDDFGKADFERSHTSGLARLPRYAHFRSSSCGVRGQTWPGEFCPPCQTPRLLGTNQNTYARLGRRG